MDAYLWEPFREYIEKMEVTGILQRDQALVILTASGKSVSISYSKAFKEAGTQPLVKLIRKPGKVGDFEYYVFQKTQEDPLWITRMEISMILEIG